MSHRTWCLNVAKEQVGCGATPVLLSIFRRGWQIPQELQTCSLPGSNPPAIAIEDWRASRGAPLRATVGINASGQHVEAHSIKVVAKLADRPESNRPHPCGASLFEIRVAVVDEQNL
jgi:hypothetical protein